MQGISVTNRVVSWAGIGAITNGSLDFAGQAGSGLTLLFPAGRRPSAEHVERALAAAVGADGRQFARISHAGGAEQGWVELLASGLTFDLTGLAPGESVGAVTGPKLFGIESSEDLIAHEAIMLAPGPHLDGAGVMIPVFRAMVSLARSLATSLGAAAVCLAPSTPPQQFGDT
jgi:hypothetical protein